MRISKVILTGAAVVTAAVLAIEAPGVLKLVLGIFWGGVIFIAGLVLLAGTLAIIGSAPGLARTENESETAGDVIVSPIDDESLAYAPLVPPAAHVDGGPPPAASAPDLPVERSRAELVGYSRAPKGRSFRES